MVEVIIVLGIVIYIMYSFGNFKITDEVLEEWLDRIKEEDMDFFGSLQFGSNYDAKTLMKNRVKDAFIYFAAALLLISFAKGLTVIGLAASIAAGFLGFKTKYMNAKNYYKKYMTYIDSLLPYYLKQLEIMCQNYTVPVALSRSITDAPDPFKSGLRELVAKIDSGDSSVDPYMTFARQYPVKDSMRMMRLLYRLSLGSQENKYQQLIMFSKSVSSLQNKAREEKYKARLEKMEGMTTRMLFTTGGLSLLLMIIAMVFMMSNTGI